MRNNVMVDLETLGKKPGCVISTIGAVRFSATGIHHEFYTSIDAQSCVDVGLTMDVSTVLWWMKQSDDARKELTDPRRLPMPLVEALTAFTEWVGSNPVIWGNGATFDNTILAAAYDACGMHAPWEFWNDACYRTARRMFPGIDRPRPGIAHHALYDARAQAEHLIEIQHAYKEAHIL